MGSDVAWRWRDRVGVVHLVHKADPEWRYGPAWYFPACRAFDPTIVWPHPKRSPLPINCMTCLVLEARGT